MKKKWKLCLLFLAMLAVLTGCEQKPTAEKGYTVYCVSSTGTKLVENSYSPAAQTFDEMLEELIGQLRSAPAGYSSVLPQEIKFNGYERGIDALRVDFSSEYYNLTNTEEVLLRAAVVKTVCQIPGVTKVMITVDGQQLQDREGKEIPAMDANTFIDTREDGINSYQYATLVLYFADKEGEKNVQEMRNLHYSSNMVLERVVVEELIKGPEDSSLKAILSSDVRIQNIYTQNGVCTITLSEEAQKNPNESAMDAQTVLYAIVNSICETCDDISGVKFEISGNSDGKFRGEVDLNQIFMLNPAVIAADPEQMQLETQEAVSTEKAKSGNTIAGVDPTKGEEQ